MIHDGLAKLIGAGSGRGSVAGLTYSETAGGNVFMGALPGGTPNRAVAVIPVGGFDADSKLPYSMPSVQIIVRGDEDPRWALDTWQAIYSALQGLRNITLPDGTWLVSCLAQQSGPIHIGRDDNRRFQYGMNLVTEVLEPTAERPA